MYRQWFYRTGLAMLFAVFGMSVYGENNDIIISGNNAYFTKKDVVYHIRCAFQTPRAASDFCGVYSVENRMLTSVSLEDSVEFFRHFWPLGEIMNKAFQNCAELKTVKIPPSVKTLDEFAFQGCSKLTSVEIPNSVTNIKKFAFQNCTQLASVTIPSQLSIIQEGTFYGCSGLRRVTIPIITKTISKYAFKGCTSMDTLVVYRETPPSKDEEAFVDFSDHCVLMVPLGKTQAYRNAGWTEEIFKGGIREIGAPAAIQPVKVRERTGSATWHDLEGRPAAAPRKGEIYIKDGRKLLVR